MVVTIYLAQVLFCGAELAGAKLNEFALAWGEILEARKGGLVGELSSPVKEPGMAGRRPDRSGQRVLLIRVVVCVLICVQEEVLDFSVRLIVRVRDTSMNSVPLRFRRKT